MMNGRPLFPGSFVEDQLKLIFLVLGIPPKDCLPQLEIPFSLPKHVCESCPKYVHESLSSKVPHSDHTAIDLLDKFLRVIKYFLLNNSKNLYLFLFY